MKHASAENFSPAQLEKLGHVFNAAKTLAFMDKSANRGGSFSLVDVPTLVSKYMQPTVKRASVSREQAVLRDPGHVKSASAVKEFDRVPNFLTLHEKAAIQVTTPSAPVDEVALRKQAARDAAMLQREQDMLRQIADDTADEFHATIEKLASELHQRGVSFATVEGDVIDLYGADGVKAASVCADYMANAKRMLKPERASETRKKARLPFDSTGLASMVKKAYDLVEYREAAIKYATTRVARRERETQAPAQNPTQSSSGAAPAAAGPHTAANETPGQEAPAGGSVLDIDASNPDTADSGAFPDSAVRGLGVTLPEGRTKAPAKDEKETVISKIMEAVEKGVKMRGGGAASKSPAEQPKLGLHAIPMGVGTAVADILKQKKNVTQKKVDEAHDDAKFSTTLQRLLVTDPIISEADPDDVASLASSIRAVAPDGARDANYLRFALREALQYGALPSHTYKDMADAQGKIDKSHVDRNNLDTARYTNA